MANSEILICEQIQNVPNFEIYLVLVQTTINGSKHHSILTNEEFQNPGYIEFTEEFINNFKWTRSGEYKTIKNDNFIYRSKGYSQNDNFKFGTYKNFNIGVVYAMDFKYIDWCINNIDSFFIYDLDTLMDYGILVHEISTLMRCHIDAFPEHKFFLNNYNTIHDLHKDLKILNSDYKLDKETIEINQNKINKYSKY